MRRSTMRRNLINRENLAAVVLCVILILVVILTSDSAPTWIYQGF